MLVVGEYMTAAFVELVASGDSTWVWVPSIVECMIMALACACRRGMCIDMEVTCIVVAIVGVGLV